MLLYARKIEDQDYYEVGTGTDSEFYESIGMTLMDVVQNSLGFWYPANKIPEATQEEIVNRKKIYILKELQKIDDKSVRALRSVANGTETEEDIECLSELNQKAKKLRDYLQTIDG